MADDSWARCAAKRSRFDKQFDAEFNGFDPSTGMTSTPR